MFFFLLQFLRKNIFKGTLVRKSYCIMNRGKFRTLSKGNDGAKNRYVCILTRSSIMFVRVLNMPLMMTVAKYWESTSNKTKMLYSILAKKTQSTFILGNVAVPTKVMMAWMKSLRNTVVSPNFLVWKLCVSETLPFYKISTPAN